MSGEGKDQAPAGKQPSQTAKRKPSGKGGLRDKHGAAKPAGKVKETKPAKEVSNADFLNKLQADKLAKGAAASVSHYSVTDIRFQLLAVLGVAA